MPWLRIDLALWIFVGVVWLVAAPFSRATVRREPLSARLAYVVPAACAAALLGWQSPAMAWLDVAIVPHATWTGALSVALTAAGIAFGLWARFTLGRNWSGTVTVKKDHELIETGPYGFARHPIYTGALIALLGTFVFGYGTLRMALVVPVVMASLARKMRTEERFMSEEFGEAYAAYRGRVKALVPFVW